MKFIHIADVHLGAEPDAGPLFSGERPRELWEALEHVAEVCEEERADLLLIAGDLFHRQPLMRELKETDAVFASLTHTKVVLIAGNHDYIRKDSYYNTFQWSENVYPLFGKEPEYLDFPELRTAVYGLSYHSREIREPLYDDLRAGGVEPFEILLAHGGDEAHIPIDRNALLDSGFSYVALGHIHKPHAPVKNRIVYSGALEPVDRNDTGPHGYVLGELAEDRESGGIQRRIRWIPCARREYIHGEIRVEVSDTMVSLKKKIDQFINEHGNENIYKIVLTGKRDPDILIDEGYLSGRGNILETADRTEPAYDIERICRENRENLLGRYIGRFEGCREGSEEYEALLEGVEALLGSRINGV